jgi:Ca2+-binding RTX toxin-like protein
MNARKTIREARSSRPALEALESRLLRTAIGVTPSGVVQITGDATSEYVEVQMVSATEFEVRAGPAAGSLAKVKRFSTVTGPTYPVAATSLAAYLGQGSDTLWTLPSAAPYPSFPLNMLVHADANGSAALKLAGGTDNIVTGDGNDTVYGYQCCDSIKTGGGNDTVYGYDVPGSYSSAVGYNDIDTIDAGDGNDTVYGGPDADSILGGAGDDKLSGNEFGDILVGGLGMDTLFGEGTSISGWEGADYLYGDDGGMDTAADGYDCIYGGPMGDYIIGQGGGGYLSGEGGDDFVYGGAGVDLVYGGSGNDTLVAYDGGDTIDAGSGADSVYGGSGDDGIDAGSDGDYVSGDAGNDLIYGNAGADNLYGGTDEDRVFGDADGDTLSGGDDNDHLYPGAGDDHVTGGNGDDTIVSIDDDTDDVLYGETGFDTFWVDRGTGVAPASDWTDDDANESETNLHRVENFENGPDKTLDGDAVADPVIMDEDAGATYVNCAGMPLFGSAGPSRADVDQNGLGDCWLMATLGAVADTNQNAIYQAVVDLGDRTYCVELGNKQYRVDADLPWSSDRGLVYAGLGEDGSLWAALVEKGYALHRDGTYESLEGDTSYWPMGKLDGTDRTIWGASDARDTLDPVSKAEELMDAGYAVVFSTKNDLSGIDMIDGPALVASHVYTVIGVDWDSWSLVLRNPWGGAGAEVSIKFDEVADYGSNPWCFMAADFTRFN